MSFPKWSDINKEVKTTLMPDLGIRNWNDIPLPQKKIIWKHFTNRGWFINTDEHTYKTINDFSARHKLQSYCNHTLSHGGPHFYGHSNRLQSCCESPTLLDFEHIFLTQDQNVVYELISYYISVLSDEKYKRFTNMFNDISLQFGLNILLTKTGIILRQEEKIIEDIYKPVLNFLADKKWEAVNRDLNDSLMDYLKNSPEGYSSSITHTVSSLQAFLQILVNGKIGKGDIGPLISLGIKNKIIPDDPFSVKIFKDINSIVMQERQEKGDPHPKEEYANEKSAKLLLNLVMIFMQHCLHL